MKTLLKANNIRTYFEVRGGFFQKVQNHVKAVDDVSIEVGTGEIVSIVGESGCGKSTLGLSLMGLQPMNGGEIYFDNHKLDFKNKSAIKSMRRDFQIIFQDPYASLNPRLTIFELLAEPLLLHNICNKDNAKEHVRELLLKVDLQPEMMERFPHSFSGGQRQRIAIARALGIKPKLIICDEIVSALDVSVQAQILELLLKLKKEMNLSLLFISHDLAVVRAISDRVYVMYLGKVVEHANSETLFKGVKHPYTEALLNSIPTLDRSIKPSILEGEVPSPINRPKGCNFSTRCPYVVSKCKDEEPKLESVNSEERHITSCHYPGKFNS